LARQCVFHSSIHDLCDNDFAPSQRRAQCIQHIEDMKAGRWSREDREDELSGAEREGTVVSDGPESEEGVDLRGEHDGDDGGREGESGQIRREQRKEEQMKTWHAPVLDMRALNSSGSGEREGHHHGSSHDGREKMWNGEIGRRMSMSEGVLGSKSSRTAVGQTSVRRARPSGLADLDSAVGR
jgi:hypothetical protein